MRLIRKSLCFCCIVSRQIATCHPLCKRGSMIAKINSVSTKKYLPVVEHPPSGIQNLNMYLVTSKVHSTTELMHRYPHRTVQQPVAALELIGLTQRKKKFVSENVRHIRPSISTVLVTMFPYRKSPQQRKIKGWDNQLSNQRGGKP